MQTAIRYFHQGRHLKPIQFYARIKKILWRPRVTEVSNPPHWLNPVADWIMPAPMPHRLLDDNRFLILGQERTLSFPDGWQDRELGRKWLMELHAFHFLSADTGARARDLIRAWIADGIPGKGPAWHPYITSNRISNWLMWALSGNALDEVMRRSLAQQIRYLLQTLEYDELDHKLFNNGKALLFAGLCLDDRDSPRWRRRGLGLIIRYTGELLGRDGGYLGLSPMYHCALLNDLLDVANLLRAYGEPKPTGLDSAIASARSWLATMCHPDNRISLFNDAAMDVVAEPAELDAYAQRLEFPSLPPTAPGLVHLCDSGFARLALGPAVALVDVGRIGPDHASSHGHADTLTFELSVNRRRLVVDTGLSTYEIMPERLRQRETAAHNTLVLDDRNSSDVWLRFKVGRRAAVQDLRESETSEALLIGAAHDGFSLRGNPLLHRRDWEMTPTSLIIQDQVTGHGKHQAQVSFHLHPDVVVVRRQDHQYLLSYGDGAPDCLLQMDSQTDVQLQRYDYHPGFNRSISAFKLVASISGVLPLALESRISWDLVT
jgi:uncharacterized heparinase superfamily protein